jgi:hypothetical protein
MKIPSPIANDKLSIFNSQLSSKLRFLGATSFLFEVRLIIGTCFCANRLFGRIVSPHICELATFPGSATVSVACVGVSPTQRYAADNFTRSMAIRACR